MPLTANRLALTLLQSFEAVLIPMMLKMYYGDSETALSIYAVATAMAFPFIMFPEKRNTATAGEGSRWDIRKWKNRYFI